MDQCLLVTEDERSWLRKHLARLGKRDAELKSLVEQCLAERDGPIACSDALLLLRFLSEPAPRLWRQRLLAAWASGVGRSDLSSCGDSDDASARPFEEFTS